MITEKKADLNPDPITGEPGSHPVGTGVGAASTAAAGAAAGAVVGGPVGALVGGAIGAAVGGLAGHAVAEAIDPTIEERYWRENYTTRPYYRASPGGYDDYASAYRYGWESRGRYPNNPAFSDIENDLNAGWDKAKGKSHLTWSEAKLAARDAWDRVNTPRAR